jgi:hypothetical protein
MKFTITHSYEKDTDTVFKVLTDAAYLMKKFAATGAKNIKIPECGERGGRFVIRRQMEIPANPPDLLKKFVKSMNSVDAVDTWQSFDKETKTGVFEVNIKGVPISMTGTLALKPAKKGCDYIIGFDVKCGIPLIGGKLAKLAEDDTRSNQQKDYAFTRKYLETL